MALENSGGCQIGGAPGRRGQSSGSVCLAQDE